MIEYSEIEEGSGTLAQELESGTDPRRPEPTSSTDADSTSLTNSITDADVLEQLVATDFNTKLVANRLSIERTRVLEAVSSNYSQVSAAMRALRLVTLYETLQVADVALDASLDKMDPDDLVKAHSQLQGAFDSLTKPQNGDNTGAGGFNLNVFLGKLPQRVRGSVETLVDMDDDEFERIANATLVGEDGDRGLAA